LRAIKRRAPEASSASTELQSAYFMAIIYGLLPIGLVAGALTLSTWAVVRSLFLPPPLPRFGIDLVELEQPRLFAALREVATVAGSLPVNQVELGPGTGIAVLEEGSAAKVILGRGRRRLRLGFWAVHELDEDELKAVLAHEFGHFSNGDTRLTPIIHHVLTATQLMIYRMATARWWARLNPVYWYLPTWLQTFQRVTAAHSRIAELLADDVAARAYGGTTLRAALTKTSSASDLFARVTLPMVSMLRRAGRRCSDVYACLEAARPAGHSGLQAERLASILDRPPHEGDSHPPIRARMARMQSSADLPSSLASPALGLFEGEQSLRRSLSNRLLREIELELPRHGVSLSPAADMDGGEQLLFAEAFVLQLDALTLSERRDPAAAALFSSFVDRSAKVFGERDPFLIAALQQLARIQGMFGRRSEARAALQQALEIASAQPQRNLGGEAGLREQLAELQDEPVG
jgi:Zn-dependent protease with chaperone function